jgi:uncharacterized protein YcfL
MKQLRTLAGFQLPFVLGCFLFVGCGSAEKDLEVRAQRVTHGVPLGSPPTQVLGYLDAQKIRHSEYERDAVKGNSIVARIPYDPSEWNVVYTSYRIVFWFDGNDRLVTSEVHPEYTGP